MCEPECPIDAIKSDDDLTDKDRHFLEINDRLSQKWPVISIIIDAPKDAKEWENKENKLALLEE
jgi:ferredoxin|tara:strand:- start:323 stop:514 length:192 start_codon:yes stop_codon:yes gene_type:complete